MTNAGAIQKVHDMACASLCPVGMEKWDAVRAELGSTRRQVFCGGECHTNIDPEFGCPGIFNEQREDHAPVCNECGLPLHEARIKAMSR